MEIIITRKARDDLYNFFNISKFGTENYTIKYINNLIESASNLSKSPYLGKKIDILNNYEIRQLIYKNHKILYSIIKNKIYILSFYHSSRNFNIKYFDLSNYSEIF